MYVKFDREIEAIKKIELTSDSTTSLLHIESETGKKGLYNGPSESLNNYQLHRLLSSDLYIPSDIFCGNEKLII